MGDFGVVTEPSTVRFERLLPGSIERVWAFLTEPAKRGRWLAGGPMELFVGGRAELRFNNSGLSSRTEPVPPRYCRDDTGTMHGRVTRCEPPRRLSYTWSEASEHESEVSFELIPEGDAVRLVLVHRRLGDGSVMVSVASGWHTHLGILAELLADREPSPFWSTHTRLEAIYLERLAGDRVGAGVSRGGSPP